MTSTTMTAVITCHERRELTVRCLTSLFAAVPHGLELDAVVVDAASQDGTADAVEALELPVTMVRGPADWYWPQGMAHGEAVAEQRDPDWILWLNDDVVLEPRALLQWMMVARRCPPSVLVGAMRSRPGGRVTYSGFTWPDRSVLCRTRVVPPTGEPTPVPGFHGNFVAVPRAVRRAVGPIDGRWPQYYADLDYALRCERAGVPVLLLPAPVGVCPALQPSWQDPHLPKRRRVRAVFGRTGWPLRSHWRLHRRYASGWWPLRMWTPHWRAMTMRRSRFDGRGGASNVASAHDGGGA